MEKGICSNCKSKVLCLEKDVSVTSCIVTRRNPNGAQIYETKEITREDVSGNR